MKKLLIVVCFLLLVACQPATVTVVVTETTTQEVISPHRLCAITNASWDSFYDGCVVSRNSSFIEGLTLNQGVRVPVRWTAWNDQASVPFVCEIGLCRFQISGTKTQAQSGLQQQLSGIENNQCYLIKLITTFRMQVVPQSWQAVYDNYPNNLIYAIARVGNTQLDWQVFSKGTETHNPADANFVSGSREFIFPVRGGSNPTPSVTMGIRTQWGAALAGSYVDIIGAAVLAAPDGYCTNTSNRF